jgi:hypothetical protein
MTGVRSLVAAVVIASAWPGYAQQTQSPPAPTTSGQTPGQTPGQVPGQTPAPGTPQAPGAPGTVPAPATPLAATLPPVTTRTFTGPVGMWFVTVRPDRVGDFEQVIAHVQSALAKSTDPQTREQAKGWRMLKATEPGPNATVMYVFLMDPTIKGAEYGFGGVLAAAYPDTTELAEIWRMYTGAITGGGSLLNLTPIAPKIVPFGSRTTPAPVTPGAVPSSTPAPAAPEPASPAKPQ